MATSFKGSDGYLDYFKVYDANGQLQYIEEFEDCRQSATNYPFSFLDARKIVKHHLPVSLIREKVPRILSIKSIQYTHIHQA